MTQFKEKFLDILSKTPIFSAIAREKLLELYERCDIVQMENGDHLMDEGTPAEEIYVILDGTVDILLNGDEGPMVIAQWSEGQVLGEASVIGIQNHSATVIATAPSIFLKLSRSTLMSLYKLDLELFSVLILNIARELARRLKKSNDYIEHLHPCPEDELEQPN